ncbi:MAG TPA: hexose kinase [Longilinea sp.]|nr:hexose kinase [Longilinea sp.]
MILTVTPNSAIDHVLFVDELIPGGNMYTRKAVTSVGGKAFDASVVLSTLGAEQLALGFAAGENGRQLEILLDNYGIPHDLIHVAGETRVAHVVVEIDKHRHSHITTQGYTLDAAGLDAFWQLFRSRLNGVSWVVSGGTLPQGCSVDFYARLTQEARETGAMTLVDTSGEPARQAAESRPAVLKMNQREFAATFDHPAHDMEHLRSAAQEVRQQLSLPALVVTCGAEGILAVTEKGTWVAKSPPQAEVNSAGAGDGVSAALAWQFSQGVMWEGALPWAAATGAAVVLTDGTADCRLEDIHRIRPDVQLQQYN